MNNLPQTFEQIKNKSDKYLVSGRAKADVSFVYGSGELLFDTEGKSYIDFSSGMENNTLGHANADWIQMLTEQADRIILSSNNYYNQQQADLAEILVGNSIEDGKVLFVNSDTEANIAAFKMAQTWADTAFPDKVNFVCLSGSIFSQMTGVRIIRGDADAIGNNPEPFRFITCIPGDMESLEEIVDDKTAAIFLELAQDETEIAALSAEFVGRASALAKEHEALIVINETRTGIARTGTLFAYQQFGIQPDILTIARGMGSGYPIAAVITGHKVSSILPADDYSNHLAGTHLACALAAEVIKSIIQQKIPEKIAAGHAVIVSNFERIMQRFPFVKAYTGSGYLMNLILDSDSVKYDYQAIPKIALNHGLVINLIRGNVLRIAPPLDILDLKLEKGLKILEKVLEDFNKR